MSIKKVHQIIRLLVMTLFFLSAVILASGQAWGAEKVLPAPEIPQPQGFCGYCHIITYPAVINRSYETWQKGKHNKVGCVECHYKPFGTATAAPMAKALSKPDGEHIPKAPPGHFSYLALGGETIKTRPQIADATCMTALCHGKPDDQFRTKKIKFAEKVPFVHEPHLAKKNQIEGMQVNCTTCHQHETQTKHFEVAEATCHLCHFANTKFNQGRAKCELCHQLPTKPIKKAEKSDEKEITHQMLQAAGVSCSSCHFDLIRGVAETKVEPVFEGGVIKTVLFLNVGQTKEENCLSCHDQAKYLKKATEKKVMHESHVTSKNARCFDCHRPIEHRKAKVNQPVPGDCAACHTEPHRYQMLLAAGPARDGIPSQPDPMFKARSNCLACHIEKVEIHKGQTIMRASARTCVQCHAKDYENMLDLWKREVGREVERAERLEKEALDILAKQRAAISQEKLKEATRMIGAARENLAIVRFGNGVHNSKYSIALLDAAIVSFKNTISYLEGREMTEGIQREE